MPVRAIGHVALFATINAMLFIALLWTAPNDLWYVEPVDAADDDGFFLASFGVMTLASPALLVLHAGALAVSRLRR